ncbi:MAG: TolC family protein, partial [Oligoflexia bacterium]|nr:TolC family protein [Oligoflexia bacterium]
HRTGLSSYLEVLQAQNTLLDTKRSYNRAKYHIWPAWVELRAATGVIGTAIGRNRL